MGRQHRFFGAMAAVVAVLGTSVGVLGGTAGALTSTTQPTLTLNRLIRT